MLPLLLDAVYLLLLVAASPWLAWKALRKGKYREGFAAKFLGCVPRRTSERPCVWLHAVSVGEVNLLVPLVAELAHGWPDCQCVISTTTMTGMALARTRFAELSVFYCPLDFSFAVRRAMGRIRPDLVVLAELELWPNLIAAACRAGARVAIVNGRLSERSLRGYRRIRPLVARTLGRIDLIAVQTAEYAERFKAIGARDESVRVTGSIKFDGAGSDRSNPETVRLRSLAGLAEGDIVLLAGSTQEPEEEMALAAFRRFGDEFPRLRLILVPRHPDRFQRVAQLLDRAARPGSGGRIWTRAGRTRRPASCWSTRSASSRPGGAAQIAFVGGSLGSRGGQNMIEPAAFGCAVSFGPNTQNFRDVVSLLLTVDAAEVIRTPAEFEAWVGLCLADPAYAAALGDRAKTIVAAQRGATGRTVELLEALMGDRFGRASRRAA